MAATYRRAGFGHTPSNWESFGDGIFGSEFGGCSAMVYEYQDDGRPTYAFCLFDRNGGTVMEGEGYTSLREAVSDADGALIDLVL